MRDSVLIWPTKKSIAEAREINRKMALKHADALYAIAIVSDHLHDALQSFNYVMERGLNYDPFERSTDSRRKPRRT